MRRTRTQLPLREMMVPRLGRLWDRGERAQVLGAIALAWRYFLLLAIPAAVGLGVLGNEVLRLLTTPELARQGSARKQGQCWHSGKRWR